MAMCSLESCTSVRSSSAQAPRFDKGVIPVLSYRLQQRCRPACMPTYALKTQQGTTPQQPQPQVARQQQQQQQQQLLQQCPYSSQWYNANWDLNLFHYLPWWLQPASILCSGLLLFTLVLVFDTEEPTLKAAIIAAGPLALYYAIALVVLPSQFQRFAVAWMREHPELQQQGVSRRESYDEGGL